MIKTLISFFIVTFLFIACAKNTLTGKNQLLLFKESDLQSMSAQQYQQFLDSNKVVSNTANKDVEMVKRVGQRITQAANALFAEKGAPDKLKDYKWEYKLVDSKEVNAWCMPGGKIVVYTGLLPITQNEAALAVVMGHEVSHALLQHGNQRMSQQLGAEVVATGLQVAVSNKPVETQNAYLAAFGLGAQVGVLLPFSRNQESEADKWGLMLAAMAGYNPEEAIPLWQRMEKAGSGQKPPEFLSTHPSEGRRIEQLKQLMPEALKRYKPVK